MGACGCGDFSGDITFPAPDGEVYVLDVYPGCEDCETPAGVVLYRFTPDEAKRWGLEGAKPLKIGEEGTGIPVLDPDPLREMMTKEAASGVSELVAEIVADGLRNHFREAAMKTFEAWRKKRARPAALPETDGARTEGERS